ncbi:hypothetical protein E4T56_gene13037 [Termitomyces sp. T112]|nr:hypothetical protein E4T56_gene13037 [Termitomyces sp. T112]
MTDRNPSEKLLTKPVPQSLRLFPDTWHPYLELMRWDKPAGTMLVFWPFAWGLTMAAYQQKLPLIIYPVRLIEYLVAAFMIRSSACTINDIVDSDFDINVERTKKRPIPSGRISIKAALLFLLAQYLIAIAVFYCILDGLAYTVTVIQLLPLSIIYPFMKRVTNFPQAWLGIAINLGFVTSYLAQDGQKNVPMLFTGMIGCWCWTMLYDTIYACQDKRDDIKAGVNSSALALGSLIGPMLVVFGLAFLAAFISAGALNQQTTAYYIISIGGLVVHLTWQFFSVDLDVPDSCGKTFRNNGQLGWIIWAGLATDYICKIYGPLSPLRELARA